MWRADAPRVLIYIGSVTQFKCVTLPLLHFQRMAISYLLGNS
jgi:hypothetical protein